MWTQCILWRNQSWLVFWQLSAFWILKLTKNFYFSAAKCICNYRSKGNPYVECLEEKTAPRPECTNDIDCPSQLACISNKCQNPCKEQRNICSRDQTCSVLDTTPLRTMVCMCPQDTVSDANGNCRAIIHDQPACTANNDCPNTDVCRNGNCILACRVENCGINAQCVSQNHRGTCSCPANYEGNPYVECSYKALMIPTFECYNHEDCPDDRICSNGRCTNPCQNRNACGAEAFCYVQSN